MSKAYDILEWGFIKVVLQRLGSHNIWVNWIIQCIYSVSYSFLLNGTSKGFVLLSRRITQGDLKEIHSHSTYPFYDLKFYLVYINWLNKKDTYEESELQHIDPESTTFCLWMTPCFFAKACRKNVKALKEILQQYKEASKQKINCNKAAITFSSKPPQDIKDKVMK